MEWPKQAFLLVHHCKRNLPSSTHVLRRSSSIDIQRQREISSHLRKCGSLKKGFKKKKNMYVYMDGHEYTNIYEMKSLKTALEGRKEFLEVRIKLDLRF